MGHVLVTGSASGIGAATRERLLADGHDVIGVDLHDADIEADLSTSAGRSTAIGETTERCGGVLSGVVACAGLGPMSGRDGALLVAVNYFGVIDVVDGLHPALAAAERASVVVIASSSITTQPYLDQSLTDACVAGDEAQARALGTSVQALGTYPATKAALARWVRQEAVTDRWVGAGVRINAIAPGVIDTPLIQVPAEDAELAAMIDAYPNPLGRRGRPEEVAALASFLVGDGSTLLCGSILFADGGTDALLRGADNLSPWEPDPSVIDALFGS